MGKELEKGTDTCITESLSVHLKLTQHYKLTIVQNKMKI